jgi:hypothetical protein
VTASDFYEWVASCARELETLEGRMDALRVPRSSGGQATRSPGISDPTAAQAMAAMGDEPVIAEGIERCRSVLRREEGVTSAVGTALGPMAALALRLHYREGNEWQAVAFELGMSLSSIYRLRKMTLAWVDSKGLVAAIGKS